MNTRLLVSIIRSLSPESWDTLPNGNPVGHYVLADGDVTFSVEYTSDLATILKIETPFGSMIGAY